MTILYYFSAVIFSAVQSVFTKKNGKDNGNLRIFQLSRAVISLIVFGTILLFSGNIHIHSLPYGMAYGIFLAISMASGYMALKKGAMGLTSAVVSFSLILPILYCSVILGESIAFFGYVGLALTALSLLLINFGKKGKGRKITASWGLYTALTLISNGICSILQKEHGNAFQNEGKSDFMFFSSAVCSVIFLIFLLLSKSKKIENSKKSITNGLFAGIGNGASGLFTLYLAAENTGSVLFPIISVSTITVSLICGWMIFGEKLSKIQLSGFAAAIFAVFFLQI